MSCWQALGPQARRGELTSRPAGEPASSAKARSPPGSTSPARRQRGRAAAAAATARAIA